MMPEQRVLRNILPSQALVLAPMSGISDPPFRLLAREKGADLAYTEMVSAEGLVRGNNGCSRLLEANPAEGPLIGQLFGTDPAVLAEAASRVQEMGLHGVDINVGCPAAKIVKKGAGAALLREPQRLREILKQVRDGIRIPLGIKIRSGWDEENCNCLEIVQMAEDCGVDLVAIHPRLRSQKFSGEADWGLIRMAKERTGLTIIGNGDVRSPADAARMLQETGCDGVMIGRGSWGNPWIFERVRRLIDGGQDTSLPTLEQKERLILRHLELHLERKSAPWGLLTFIKHVGWYLKGYPAVAAFRKRINTIRSKEAFIPEIEAYFRYVESIQGGTSCPLSMPTA
jgi:tRNA-dihydrouridine synthase B